MLPAIGDIATQQTNGTKATMQAITQLLNYCATHPDAFIHYHASDMCLQCREVAFCAKVFSKDESFALTRFLSELYRLVSPRLSLGSSSSKVLSKHTDLTGDRRVL